MRIDRLLCHLRFVRTRSRATALVESGHLRRNGTRVARVSQPVEPGDVLTVPLALFAIAFTGRLINLLVVGSYEGWWLPMAVELGHVAILALAIKVWPWRRRRSKFRAG